MKTLGRVSNPSPIISCCTTGRSRPAWTTPLSRTFEDREYPVRRSRGFAPDPIDLGMPVREILACGGELKNTLCLTKDHYAILSPHIGDLENMETMEFFREALAHLKRFFRVAPRGCRS